MKPSAIIFGGLNTCSRALAAFLVPLEGEPLVSHLRIVDKYSVAPPTTYLGSEFPGVLRKPGVEYRQANLTVPATIASCFDHPEGQTSYDYIFDLTGEIRQDRPEMIQINMTCQVAKLIGLEAARRKVKAYVRLQHPFYETPEKGKHDEKEDIKPSGTIGIWWHETLRILAAIENLNLVILRIGFVYGPYTDFGIITSAITVGAVYGYLKKPMKSMWSPGKNPSHTVHVYDVAGSMWACATWMASLGRKEADILAGEVILFHNDKSKVKEVASMPPHDQKLIAPLFNLVDDSNSTQLSCGEAVTSFFGTTYEFFNFLVNTMAKFKLDDVVEDINEAHVGGWTEMLLASNPPIVNPPVSAYLDNYALSKHSVAFNNSKAKAILGYRLQKPEFNHDVIQDIVDKWKAEGSWPILDGK
jgi:hypothetical protein